MNTYKDLMDRPDAKDVEYILSVLGQMYDINNTVIKKHKKYSMIEKIKELLPKHFVCYAISGGVHCYSAIGLSKEERLDFERRLFDSFIYEPINYELVDSSIEFNIFCWERPDAKLNDIQTNYIAEIKGILPDHFEVREIDSETIECYSVLGLTPKEYEFFKFKMQQINNDYKIITNDHSYFQFKLERIKKSTDSFDVVPVQELKGEYCLDNLLVDNFQVATLQNKQSPFIAFYNDEQKEVGKIELTDKFHFTGEVTESGQVFMKYVTDCLNLENERTNKLESLAFTLSRLFNEWCMTPETVNERFLIALLEELDYWPTNEEKIHEQLKQQRIRNEVWG